MALWSSLVSTPLVLYGMWRSQFFAGELAKKYPTAWLRNGAVMPLTALFLVGLAWTAPLGCDQYASLRFPSVEKKTCIDGQPPDQPIRTGQVLDVGITAFPFGFLIDSLAPCDKASS
jgi:hypothetical protein